MFILKRNLVRNERIRSVDADIDGFCDFPYFEEDAKALTQHYEPGSVLRLIKKILNVSHWSPLEYKEDYRLPELVSDDEGVYMTTLLMIVRNETPVLSCCQLYF